MSELLQQYVELAQRVAGEISLPAVSAIHLPKWVEEPQKEDEFGFVVLEDGSVGPFYTSLDDSLAALWQRLPGRQTRAVSVLALVEGLLSNDVAETALALGAFNAMSQHVMREAGFNPVEQAAARRRSNASAIAMVGFIRPMVEKLLQKGLDHVLVLERNPARVDVTGGVRLSTDPSALGEYDEIVCTASTLINDSIGEILAHRRVGAHLALVGPSGSGLPDVLFRQGVDEVGGFWTEDPVALTSAVALNEGWGEAGAKYSLTPEVYPGIDKLLEDIRQHRQ